MLHKGFKCLQAAALGGDSGGRLSPNLCQIMRRPRSGLHRGSELVIIVYLQRPRPREGLQKYPASLQGLSFSFFERDSDTERERAWELGGETQRERQSQAASTLSSGLHSGLHPVTPRSGPERKSGARGCADPAPPAARLHGVFAKVFPSPAPG